MFAAGRADKTAEPARRDAAPGDLLQNGRARDGMDRRWAQDLAAQPDPARPPHQPQPAVEPVRSSSPPLGAAAPASSMRLQRMLPTVLRALHRVPGWQGTPLFALDPMPTTGLAHDHVRILATGRLLRIPRQSQMGLSPADNLAYEAACFTRVAETGAAPRLHAVLDPSAELPMGALLLDEIFGRPAVLPDDLEPIARSLAAMHGLPMAAAANRGPLRDPDDPLADTLAEIDRQARHLDAGVADTESRHLIRSELARAMRLSERSDRPPKSFIAFDAHPGNFIIDGRGRARLVDLEKCRYGHAGLDLAHATLYTSTTWDVASRAVLTPVSVARFYGTWLSALPPDVAAAHRPWLAPLRRVMWLWSVTWCAKWRVMSKTERKDDAARQSSAEDWSAANTAGDVAGDALIDHVDERTAHYLEATTVRQVIADWAADGPLAEFGADG